MSISFKQLNNKINSIRFNERLVWAAIKSIIQTITGNAPLILTNAVNNSITSLTQYGLVTQPPKFYYDFLTQKGKCTQDGTPTPSAPVDIMCNNGALKWDSVNQRVYTDGTPEVLTVFENLLNTETNITGKYIKENGSIGTASDTQYTDLIPVTAGETYVCSLVSGRNSGDDKLHAYNENGTWVKQLESVSASGKQGSKLAMTATIDSGISYVRLSYGITDTEARVEKTSYDQLINTFYETATANDVPFIKDSSTPVQSPYNSTWKVGVYFEAIPGDEYVFSHDVLSNGTRPRGGVIHVGFYEKAEDVTDTSKCLSHLKGVQQFTVPNEAHYVVIVFDSGGPFTFSFVGVVKVDSGYQRQTASVPMLLSVGDVKDEVELIHGTLTRRVTACLYDGTQPVGDVYMSTTGGKDAGAIIVYPLATATTEQITGQNLTMSPNSEVSIVANVSDIETEIGRTERTPSPEHPLPLFCNNGELKWNGTEIVTEGTPEVLTVSGKNLLNTATNITGYYISSSGVITNGDDAQYTDLIPVTAGETYVWSLISNRESGGNNRWHGYNSAGNWVQQIAFKSSGQGLGLPFALTAVIPNGISYVRLSYGINDTESMICVSANQEISWNGFYKSSLGNGIHVDNMSKLTSPYITQGSYGGPCIVCNVEPGKMYTVSHTMTGPTKYIGAFYTEAEDVTDGTKQIEGTYFEVSASTPYLFTAPEGAHYVVISFQKAGPTTYIFDDESVVVTLYDAIDYQPYVELQTASVPTLLSVGDVKDEVELIAGTYTHRCAACEYDGTQDVGDTYLSTTGGKDTGAIIVYPLATPTTEQITGQNLVTNEGTNIVDVTAEVSPVELKVNFSQTKE